MRNKLVLVLVISLWVAVAVTAQDTTELIYGAPVSGELNDTTASMRYSFNGTAGDNIYISMFSPDYSISTYLILYGPNGTQLQEAYNNAVGSLIGPFALSSTGTYTIEAGRPDWDSASGPFALLVDRAKIQEITGGEISGTLPAEGAAAFYTYTGQANTPFSYQIIGADIALNIVRPESDFYLNSYVGDEILSAFNMLPTDGEYSVFIQTIHPGGSDYTLRLSPLEVIPVALGEGYSGSITEATPVVFSFEGQAGKMLKLDAVIPGADYSAWVEVYNANQSSYSLISDYGSGPNGMPRIDPFIVPENATYYVALNVDDYAPAQSTFDYEFSVAPSTLLSLAPGKALSGEISPETGRAIYAYNGQLDERIRVTLEQTGGSGGLSLTIRTPDQYSVVEMRAYAGFRSVSFEMVLTQSGMHLFEISNQDYENAVAFSILVGPVE